MTIGVDSRSNSIIVAAQEPLYRQVEALVAELDQEGMQTDEAMTVVSVNGANPELIQKALQSLVGQEVNSNSASSNSNSNSSRGSSSSGRPQGGGSEADAIQRRSQSSSPDE